MCTGLPLTQLLVLVVCQDQDDVGPDVAAVPLEARPQPLAGGHVAGAQRHKDEQEADQSARHGL